MGRSLTIESSLLLCGFATLKIFPAGPKNKNAIIGAHQIKTSRAHMQAWDAAMDAARLRFAYSFSAGQVPCVSGRHRWNWPIARRCCPSSSAMAALDTPRRFSWPSLLTTLLLSVAQSFHLPVTRQTDSLKFLPFRIRDPGMSDNEQPYSVGEFISGKDLSYSCISCFDCQLLLCLWTLPPLQLDNQNSL
jgi:hypothetical protein